MTTRILLFRVMLLLAIHGVSSFLPKIPHHHRRIAASSLPPLRLMFEKEKAASVVSNAPSNRKNPVEVPIDVDANVSEGSSWKDRLVQVLDVNGDGRVDHKDAGAIAALAFLSWSLMGAPATAIVGGVRSFSSSASFSRSYSPSRSSSFSRISSSSSRTPSSPYRNYSGSRSYSSRRSSNPSSTPSRQSSSSSSYSSKPRASSSRSVSSSSNNKSPTAGKRVNISLPKSSSPKLNPRSQVSRGPSSSSSSSGSSKKSSSLVKNQSQKKDAVKASFQKDRAKASDSTVSSSNKKSAAVKASKAAEITPSKSLPNTVTSVGSSANAVPSKTTATSKKVTPSSTAATKDSSAKKSSQSKAKSIDSSSTRTFTNGESEGSTKAGKTSTKVKDTYSSTLPSKTKDGARSFGTISGTASPIQSTGSSPPSVVPAASLSSVKNKYPKKDVVRASFQKDTLKKKNSVPTPTSTASPIKSTGSNSTPNKAGRKTPTINTEVKAPFRKDLEKNKNSNPATTSAPIKSVSGNSSPKNVGKKKPIINGDANALFQKDLAKKKASVPIYNASPANSPRSNPTPKKAELKTPAINSKDTNKDKAVTSSGSKDEASFPSSRKQSGKRIGGRVKSDPTKETRRTRNTSTISSPTTTRTIIRDNYIVTDPPYYNNYGPQYYRSGAIRYYNDLPQPIPDSTYNYNDYAPPPQQQQEQQETLLQQQQQQVYPPYRRLKAPTDDWCNQKNQKQKATSSACDCNLPRENELIDILVDPQRGLYVKGGVTLVNSENCDFTAIYLSDDGSTVKKSFHVIPQKQAVLP